MGNKYELRHFEAILMLHQVVSGEYEDTKYHVAPSSDHDSDCLMLTLQGVFLNPLKDIICDPPQVRFHFATISGQLRLRLESGQILTVKKNQVATLGSRELAYFYPDAGYRTWYGLWYWEML